jgi:mutator protein MutT
MTKIVPGVVEVYVIRRDGGDWRVLLLKRAKDTKRPGSWETVYGKIDKGESPEHAAVREIGEETGLEVSALYNLTVTSFYLHTSHTIQMCIVFVAFVEGDSAIILSEEHQQFEWLSVDDAKERFTWPRSVQALTDARRLLATGDAGPVEDVLRVI